MDLTVDRLRFDRTVGHESVAHFFLAHPVDWRSITQHVEQLSSLSEAVAPSNFIMMPVCEWTPTAVTSILPLPSITYVPAPAASVVDVKKRFFLFCPRFLRFWRFVLFSKRFFLFLENVGKVQSGKQIDNKHFQNNSNEIDLWFFCFMSNDLRCLPINF